MALDQEAVLEKLRLRMAELSGLVAAYSTSQSTPSAGGVPAALQDYPCALVLPDRTKAYLVSNGRHRHTYNVRILLIVGGADYTENANVASPLLVRAIEKLTGNVTLGGSANSCVFESNTGLVTLEWGGLEYLGYEILVEVSESAAATVATGS